VSFPCVESDFLGPARRRHGSNHVKRLIAIERSDLNRDYIFNLNELAPEFVGQQSPSNRGLQVEAISG